MAAKVDGGYRCPKCGETKPAEDYYVAKGKKNGLSQYCRACTVLERRQRRFVGTAQAAIAAAWGRRRGAGRTALGTLAELLALREAVRRELGEGTRNPLEDVRRPAPEIANLPIGDLLCWCDGLVEHDVATILDASEINWGRPVAQLTPRDTAMLCFQIKARHPEAWERWRSALPETLAA